MDDLYVLDNLLRRSLVIDWYTSLIWTERVADNGDFECVIVATAESRRLFTEDTMLGMLDSDRIMVVETVSEADGMLTATGRELSKILMDRLAKETLLNLTEQPKWVLQGRPHEIMLRIFDQICVRGVLNVQDKIPFITQGYLNSPGTIPFSDTEIVYEFDPDTVFNVFKDLADAYRLGFRLVRNMDFFAGQKGDKSQLFFEVYSGSNRTTSQSSNAAVIFSPSLENLDNIKKLRSLADYKNVAYVLSPNGTTVVYADETGGSVSGFARRVLIVNVSTAPQDGEGVALPPGAALTTELTRLGREALDKHRAFRGIDGEVSPLSDHIYKRDYNLGDMVEMRDEDGVTSRMRVVEHTKINDVEGKRSYPTLSVDLFITPGSWLDWDYNQVWQDANGTWADA